MADRFNSTTGGAKDTTTAFAETDGGAGPASVPTSADTVTITANGANLTAGTAASDWGPTTLSGGTLACGATAMTMAGFTLSGGTFTGSGTFACNGNLIWTSGTNSHTGAWTQGTGNLSWNNTTKPIVSYTAAASSTITLTAQTLLQATVTPATCTIAMGAQNLFLGYADTGSLSLAGIWSSSGGVIFINSAANRTFTGSINVGTVGITEVVTLGAVVTHTASVTCGPLSIRPSSAGDVGTVAVSALTAGAVTLGHATVSGSGILNLGSGTHTIASIARGNAANTQNALGLGSCNLTLSGCLNGTGIAVTNTAAVVTCTSTGSIINTTVTGTQLVVGGLQGNVNVVLGVFPPTGEVWEDGTVAAGYGPTGTEFVPGRIDCPVSHALYTGTGYFGDPAALVDGDWIAPSRASVVQLGHEHYGPGSSYGPGEFTSADHWNPATGTGRDGTYDLTTLMHTYSFGGGSVINL